LSNRAAVLLLNETLRREGGTNVANFTYYLHNSISPRPYTPWTGWSVL